MRDMLICDDSLGSPCPRGMKVYLGRTFGRGQSLAPTSPKHPFRGCRALNAISHPCVASFHDASLRTQKNLVPYETSQRIIHQSHIIQFGDPMAPLAKNLNIVDQFSFYK